jgi:hypothetical protein
MNTSLAGIGWSAHAGDILEVDAAHAARFLEAGIVSEIRPGVDRLEDRAVVVYPGEDIPDPHPRAESPSREATVGDDAIVEGEEPAEEVALDDAEEATDGEAVESPESKRPRKR